LLLGNLDESEQHVRAALYALAELDEPDRVAEMITALAGVSGARGDFLRSARLGGAGWSIWTAIGTLPVGPDLAKAQRHVADARKGLSPEDFGRAWSEGGALTAEQAVEQALSQKPSKTTAS
jgi:hypothetical protein